MMWSVWESTPLRCVPCLIYDSSNSKIKPRYMRNHPWTTTTLMMYMILAPGSENHHNIWACQRCSWRWCNSLWDDSPLSSLVHVSHSAQKTVGWHIHTCVIIIGWIHHWWGTWFYFLVIISRVTAEHVCGAFGGHVVVCRIIHPLSDVVHTSDNTHQIVW